MQPVTYVGRFAPSPSGPLHLGSFICALASYLDARHHGGRWLLRIEDLDPPRARAGAADCIMQSLRAHGLHWDGAVLRQSTRHRSYAAAVAQLLSRDLAFYCDCSRAQLAGSGGFYPGRCRQRGLGDNRERAVRLRADAQARVEVLEQLQAPLPPARLDDFIIRRRDQLFAYQLAVVIDDACQGITRVLRGADLYDSTPRQLYLQHLLGLPRPDYLHIPVLTDSAGRKLSKQTRAPPLRDAEAADNLRLALRFLGQPATDSAPGIEQLLRQASAQWQRKLIPARRAERLPTADRKPATRQRRGDFDW